jgi:hypothetical protein
LDGAGVAPPALDVEVPDVDELVVGEAVDEAVDEAAVFAPGSGVNGSRADPPCCFEEPLVVSETGRLGFTGA